MSVSQQPSAEDSASAVTAETGAVDQQIQKFLDAIRSDDGAGVGAAIERLDALLGQAATAPLVAALAETGLTEAMLATMTRSAKLRNTDLAWTQLASAATIVGRTELAAEAAGTALKIEPASLLATLILAIAANRHGKPDEALRVMADLVALLPEAKNQPYFIIQTAIAEIARNQPKAALAVINAGLAQLTAAGLEFDAEALRAQAFSAMSERASEIVTAWERVVAVSKDPAQFDYARDNLVAALLRAKHYDEALRQLDIAIPATTNAAQRLNWLQARPAYLEATGDIDGALSALDDLLAATADHQARAKFLLQQARIAVRIRRWKDAAEHFDEALTEVSADADASQVRQSIQIEKVQTLASPDIDLVLTDLDELDSAWTAPTWPIPIDLRVGGLMSAGRLADALAWLDQRLANSPALADHPAAHHLRAEVLLKLGRADEAMQEYARAANIEPTLTDPRAWFAALLGATVTQQWEVAIAAYEQLNKLDQSAASDATVRVVAAQAYLRANNPEQTLKLTDDAQPTLPYLVTLRDVNRAQAQFRLGRYKDTLATTAAALDRNKNDPSSEGSPEFLLSLHLMRAQTFNQLGQFEDARVEATAAIEVPDQSDSALPGLNKFVRLGAFMQRSLALHKLERTEEAHDDIDAAIKGFEGLRNSVVVRVMEGGPEFETFESSLWYAKGAVLQTEDRSEEALAAYTRAERLEKDGNSAAIAQGYSFASTDAFHEAMFSFERAVDRARDCKERAAAFAGKGRALVHLGKFERAIGTLQTALSERLTEEPDKDPLVFELLGIAYNALKRHRAAQRAFYRAWKLTDDNKHSANVARGVSSAALLLGEPKVALEFLKEVEGELPNDPTLYYNRAAALNALGDRAAAVKYLVKAKDLGLEQAQKELDRLDAPVGLGLWTQHWLGAQARPRRRRFGIALLIFAATGLAAPLFQWWLNDKVDWYLLLIPSMVALVLLALPNMKSFTVGVGDLKMSLEPFNATGHDAAGGSFIMPTIDLAAPERFDMPRPADLPIFRPSKVPKGFRVSKPDDVPVRSQSPVPESGRLLTQ